MSHTVHVTAAMREETGEAVIKHLPALRRACAALGLAEPEFVENKDLGIGRDATGYMVHLNHGAGKPHRHWDKPLVFDVTTGDEYWDNWSPYDAKHIAVRQGRKRIGEEGRWGSLALLDELRVEYVKAANAIIVETLQHASAVEGSTLQQTSIAEDGKRIELLLTQV